MEGKDHEQFDNTPRFEPKHMRWILSRIRGSEISDRTWCRMLKFGRVSRDADKKYGPDELAHLIDLVVHLLRGGTYRQFELWKFEGGKPFNPADLDVEYEVIQ